VLVGQVGDWQDIPLVVLAGLDSVVQGRLAMPGAETAAADLLVSRRKQLECTSAGRCGDRKVRPAFINEIYRRGRCSGCLQTPRLSFMQRFTEKGRVPSLDKRAPERLIYVRPERVRLMAFNYLFGVIRVIEDQITTLRPYNARYAGDHRLFLGKDIRR
jgi:hypothetical protein